MKLIINIEEVWDTGNKYYKATIDNKNDMILEGTSTNNFEGVGEDTFTALGELYISIGEYYSKHQYFEKEGYNIK